MSALHKLVLPLVLILGACGSDEPEAAVPGDAAASAPTDLDADRSARYAAKFAKLDVDGDGSISKSEIAGHKLAPLFAEFDADGNELLSKDEYFAAKKARHGGKGKRHRGKHHRGKHGGGPQAFG